MVRSSRLFRSVVVFGCSACAGLALTPTSASASSHRLHVSSASGNDANACTAAAPCKTIGRAVGLAQPGDAVVVGPGSYPESVTLGKRVRLSGRGATIDASGKVNGIVVSGAAAAGSVVKDLHVVNAIGEGILVVSTSHVALLRDSLENNDQGLRHAGHAGVHHRGQRAR